VLKEYQMLTKFDDFCIHQTSNPVAQPSQSDRNFYDRYWFNGFDKKGEFFFEIGFGVYPNRFVMDGHFSVVMDGKQYAFHASRRAPEDRSETVVGPLKIEVLEPMKMIRVVLEENETGICCDMTFSGRTSATLEPKNLLAEGVHVIMDTSRFAQLGFWQGYFSIDGKRTELHKSEVPGVRDKSWGVRPVGEPQGGAPGLLNQEPGVYWVWCPIHFDNFCTQFGTFQDHDGNARQVSACKVPVYDSVVDIPVGVEPGHVEMDKAMHRIQWKKGTRHAASAELELHSKNEVMKIQIEPLLQFQMLGIGYQHPEWGHGVWKGDNVFAREEWVLDELDPLDYKHIHVHQVIKATMGDLVGFGTLETIVFGRHDPSGFKDILDGAE
jgi:hypothetical protein